MALLGQIIRMKSIIKALVITSLIGVNSCSSNIRKLSYDLSYNMNLEVAKGKDKKETAELKRKVFISDDEKPLNYKDQYIQAEWQPVRDGLWFSIKNKTDAKIKILWNNAYFSDNESGSFKIEQNNLDKYTEESVILPESFYENYILPYGNSKDKYFPSKAIIIDNNQQEKKLNKFIKNIKDKFISTPVQILMPIEIDGIIYDYRFLFSFNDINVSDDE